MKITRHKTKNGLPIIVIENPEMDSCMLSLYVRGGSRVESLGNNGMTHLIEHLIFKGSKNFPNITDLFRELDVQPEGYTERESSSFSFKFPGKNTDQVIRIVADIFMNPAFNKKDISFEKDVIREELLGLKEDMPKQFYNACLKHLFSHSSFSLPPEGRIESIIKLSRTEIKSFFAKHYICGNMCLVFITPRLSDLVLNKLLSAFGDLQLGKKIEFKYPSQIKGEYTKNISLPGSGLSHISFFFNAYPIKDSRYRIAKFFAMLLDRKLHYEMREKRPLVYEMDTYHNFYSDFGFLEVATRCEKEKKEKVIAELKAVINELKFEKSEIDSLKKAIQKRVKDGMNDPYNLSYYYGLQCLSQPAETSSYEDDALFVQNITLEDIEKVKKDLLDLNASALFFS